MSVLTVIALSDRAKVLKGIPDAVAIKEGKVCTGLKLLFIKDFKHFPDYNCAFLVFSITLCSVAVSDVLH